MDQPYSPFADWLSKFNTSSEPIQALWILALVATVLGVAWSVTAPLRLWLASRRERGEPRGRLVYGVYRDADGRWLLYADGAVWTLPVAPGHPFSDLASGDGDLRQVRLQIRESGGDLRHGH